MKKISKMSEKVKCMKIRLSMSLSALSEVYEDSTFNVIVGTEFRDASPRLDNILEKKMLKGYRLNTVNLEIKN